MVAQVLSHKITDWDEYSGRFQAIDTVEVRPRVSGYIDRVLFREGQAVKQGETLIVIDPRPYQADFDRAKAGLAGLPRRPHSMQPHSILRSRQCRRQSAGWRAARK